MEGRGRHDDGGSEGCPERRARALRLLRRGGGASLLRGQYPAPREWSPVSVRRRDQPHGRNGQEREYMRNWKVFQPGPAESRSTRLFGDYDFILGRTTFKLGGTPRKTITNQLIGRSSHLVGFHPSHSVLELTCIHETDERRAEIGGQLAPLDVCRQSFVTKRTREGVRIHKIGLITLRSCFNLGRPPLV